MPLERGKNSISLRAANADGWSRNPGLLTVEYVPPPPPKAEIELIRPRQNVVVTSPHFEVEFLVRSASPLVAVELARGPEVLFRASGLGRLRRNAEGVFELRASPRVDSKRGTNFLTVRAVNGGGLEYSRYVEDFTALLLNINRIYKAHSAIKIAGI